MIFGFRSPVRPVFFTGLVCVTLAGLFIGDPREAWWMVAFKAAGLVLTLILTPVQIKE